MFFIVELLQGIHFDRIFFRKYISTVLIQPYRRAAAALINHGNQIQVSASPQSSQEQLEYILILLPK